MTAHEDGYESYTDWHHFDVAPGDLLNKGTRPDGEADSSAPCQRPRRLAVSALPKYDDPRGVPGGLRCRSHDCSLLGGRGRCAAAVTSFSATTRNT